MARSIDPRAEALAVSRIRGNSLKREEQENLPPKEAPKPFSALKASFEDLSRNPESNYSARRNFGSKVGRLKSMFQSGHVGKSEKGAEDLLKSPPSPGGAQNIPHIELDKSPEVKRKKTSELHSHSSAGLPLDRSPTRQESRLLETASHVERFNHTRAMFARMEEENRQASERQARLRYRKHSPGGTSSSTSPALSPISSTPTSPDGRKRSPSRERIAKSASHESLGKPRSSSDPARVNKISYRSNTDPTQPRPRSENFDQVSVSGIHSRSEGNLRGGNFPNAPGGLLYKRRSQEDEILEELRRDAERNGEHQLSDWSEKDVREYSSHSNSRPSLRKEEAMDTGVDNRPYDDVQHNSQYSRDNNANQGRRSRRDHYISSTYQHKHSQQQQQHQQPSGMAGTHDHRDSEVVMRRKNQGEYQSHVAAGKRLSKEEIQAAIDRADVYLSHVSSPETTPERKPEKSKRWSQEQRAVATEDQTDNTGEVREWTKYKSQRHSRGSDHLDDKVSDVSKLDEISSVSSIASYRKARAEKSPSPSPVPSPASPSSSSDAEKSGHSQSTTKAYVELKKGEPSSPQNLNVPTRPPRGTRRSSPGPPLPAKPAHLTNSSYKTSVVDPEDGLTQITNRPRPKAVYPPETSNKPDMPPPPSYSVATAGIAKTTTDPPRPVWGDDAPDSHPQPPLLTKDSADILLSPSETVTPAHVISVEVMEEMTEAEAEILLSKR